MSTYYSDWPIRIDPLTQNVPDIATTQESLHTIQPYGVFPNVTKVPLDDHNFLALLILPILCVTGLIGNVLVCIAIWTDRRLHNVTNYFLFSLALADMLVCMVVMPLAILVEVKQGVWIWSFGLCLLYTYADVFLCSASIVHISVISLDRYMGISRPLKLRNKSRTVVVLKICFVWIMTIIISCPLAALAIIEPETILYENMCTIRSRKYMIYGSTLSFLIPFIIMTITFTKTTQLLNKQANTLSQKSNEGSNGSNGLRRTVMQHKKLVYTRTNSYNVPPSPQSRTMSGKRIGSTNGATLQMSPLVKYKSASTDQEPSIKHPYFKNVSVETEEDSIADHKTSLSGKSVTEELQHLKSHLQRESTRIRSQFSQIRARLLKVARRKRRRMDSTNSELANEHKATRVLSVVFACFFTCWAPFFIMNFTLGFCGDQCSVPSWLNSVILWLGYLSSTLNPVIYTTFNRRFREAFLRIIRCQCLKPRENVYSRSHVFLTGEATWTCVDKPALIYNANREFNNTIVIQNDSPKSQWINRSLNPKNRVRALMSTSSSGSSDKRMEVPGILLSKPLSSPSSRSRSQHSLQDLPQNILDNNLQGLSNRRFSATGPILSGLESKRLLKAQANGLLCSTPVLTISNYDEEQSNQVTPSWTTSSSAIDAFYNSQKISFTTAESIPNIDEDTESSESESLLTPMPITVRSQISLLPHPYFD